MAGIIHCDVRICFYREYIGVSCSFSFQTIIKIILKQKFIVSSKKVDLIKVLS